MAIRDWRRWYHRDEKVEDAAADWRREVVARPKPAPEPTDGDWADDIPGVHFVTREEGIALFDQEARKTLGISGDEFLQRWDAGEYWPVPDTTAGRAIGRLAMMIPFARRTKV